jgi:thymidylate synthase (FAD)
MRFADMLRRTPLQAEYISHYGDDLLVVNTARVSFGKWKKEQDDGDVQLIRYLAKHNHWSPFSHPKATFRLRLPIFLARQWEKHRIGVVRGYEIYDHNEISRRYVSSEPEFFTPHKWRKKPTKSKKQGSNGPLDSETQEEISKKYEEFINTTSKFYNELLNDYNVAPEQARIVLPQSMMTEWIETGSLSYWARLCSLRLDSHAQREIQTLANTISTAMGRLFPISWEALLNESKS